MTYTFKLARRLAVSRRFTMLPAMLLFAACNGDTTAPETDWRPREVSPVSVSVNPSTVTIETNQLIRFLAHGRNSAGDSVYAPITWHATGGTILPDGRFSSAATGTFVVTGATRHRYEERLDTSLVMVVRRQPELNSIEIAPQSVTLAPGVSQTFLVTGRLKDGRAVPVGVMWKASGGTIDAGGNFVAGDTAGTHRVIATSTSMSISDTAVVTITAPPSPPPPPAPAPPPPAPTLEKITLLPASATLAPSATRQFTAYGRTTAGDSVSVNVVFAATGGTVTQGGLYTAGSTAGTYRIIATSGSLADTSSLTVTKPLGSGPAGGIPFGPYAAWDGLVLKPNTEMFTASIGSVTADNIVSQITQARSNRIRLILAMTGGGHDNYMSVINGVFQFDYAKWKAKMDTYNTPAIKDAVAKAVADGSIIGNVVMDEPHAAGSSTNPKANTWGPAGTMTKARVDAMCAYVKSMFPTMAVGVVHHASAFEPTKLYSTCEFISAQYAARQGDVTAFRDVNLSYAERDGIEVVFAMNNLNGGVQDKDGTWDCTGPGQGGLGQWEPLCRMTPEQIRTNSRVLGTAGCALLFWRYDSSFMASAVNQQAFRDVATMLAATPGKSCKRG
jgi:hypothetical protein